MKAICTIGEVLIVLGCLPFILSGMVAYVVWAGLTAGYTLGDIFLNFLDKRGAE